MLRRPDIWAADLAYRNLISFLIQVKLIDRNEYVRIQYVLIGRIDKAMKEQDLDEFLANLEKPT